MIFENVANWNSCTFEGEDVQEVEFADPKLAQAGSLDIVDLGGISCNEITIRSDEAEAAGASRRLGWPTLG